MRNEIRFSTCKVFTHFSLINFHSPHFIDFHFFECRTNKKPTKRDDGSSDWGFIRGFHLRADIYGLCEREWEKDKKALQKQGSQRKWVLEVHVNWAWIEGKIRLALRWIFIDKQNKTRREFEGTVEYKMSGTVRAFRKPCRLKEYMWTCIQFFLYPSLSHSRKNCARMSFLQKRIPQNTKLDQFPALEGS